MFRGSRTSLSSKKYRVWTSYKHKRNNRKKRGKCSHNLLFLWPLLKGNHALFMGREQYFWFPKPGFNLYSEDILTLRTWLTTRRVGKCTLVTMVTDFTASHLNRCTALVEIQHNVIKSMIVFCIHLAVWNNVCSRFRGIEYKKIYFICWLIVKKKPAQPLFMGHFPW